MPEQSLPRRLYKYKAFTPLSLELLLADQVFFADPSTFNDPLDTRPRLEADLDNAELQSLLVRLAEARLALELAAAAKGMRTDGPKTQAHILSRSQALAQALADEVDQDARHPDLTVPREAAKTRLLRHAIERELLHRYERGILSLASRHDCPLMWSHYGDQHRGLCIGYSVPERQALELHKVSYGGHRRVMASDVRDMLNGEEEARRRVDEGVLLRKAHSWRYEREWRLIGTRGLSDSPLELEEVIFGLRCPEVVRHSVARALSGRHRKVKLYAITERPGTFLLRRAPVDEEELAAEYPRRALDVWEDFGVFDSQ